MTARRKPNRVDRIGDLQLWALCGVLGVSVGCFFDAAGSEDGSVAALTSLEAAAEAPDELGKALARLPVSCRARLAEIACGIAAETPQPPPAGLLPREG